VYSTPYCGSAVGQNDSALANQSPLQLWTEARLNVSACVQLRKQLDDDMTLNEARRNLEFGSVRADIEQQFNEMDEILKKSRQNTEV
jgi:hypothetical protein